MSYKKEATVIGGGVAGCGAALQLAKKGWKVTIYEKNKLLSGTSSKAPGRMHLGFHYVDVETSITLLKATLQFVQNFQGFCFQEKFHRDHPIRRTRYFITKDSLFSPNEILSVYESLKAEYARLVEEDVSNMVLGPPEHFFRILRPEEYEQDVAMEKIAIGVETIEEVLNWSKFEQHILKAIKEDDNIIVEENAEAVSINQTKQEGAGRFVIKFKHELEEKVVVTNYVINCTWGDIERINTMAGFSGMPWSRTNRLKALLEVELPHGFKNANSISFCMGPFCTFTNDGHGKGLLSYEPVTMMEVCEDVHMSRKMIRLMEDGPSEEEFSKLAQGILDGATRFIPAMKHAKIMELRFLIVQTHGKVSNNLFDATSSIHKRAYSGVRAEGRGWVSNPCMKLTYMVRNAELVTDILENHYQEDTLQAF